MLSKRAQEGYLLIDHRAGLGITPEQARMSGGVPVGHGATFESATITCSHCQSVVVLNPDRTRARGYCPKCDHYVCDACETIRAVNGGECKTVNQIITEAQEATARKLPAMPLFANIPQ